ncbi:hypothetical protein NE235_09125 [Actinoallomurus spadix]|uniref:Abortive infection protein n=1 Tax=Actinoallomurus spadix TaxID=79912 RepID=A0ABN0W6K9_9ACTN|nr:hypothetical protein [Actinoallomurus spadix]MCO5986268.1 hypothetical protein [Actinoallomurus spadix]
MRRYGIGYDTGFINLGVSTRQVLDPEVVRREMRVIREDLHCDAVRVTGSDPERLELAATLAAEAGLEVWFSPFTCDLSTDELLDVLADCAERAERLRRGGAEIVLVTGAELSLFTKGFLPGDVCMDRIDALLTRPDREALAALPGRMNDFLAKAVDVVRRRFTGKITYASVHLEGVDWTPFDFVSIDSYRTKEIAAGFAEGVRALVEAGKPVAITEFGAPTYRGAADRSSIAWDVIEWEGATPIRLNGDYVRDEAEQAAHLRELLEIFDAEGVDSAFVHTFAQYHLPHRSGDLRDDLDLASYGVVKVIEDGDGRTLTGLPWEPKAAFSALADHYGRRTAGRAENSR